MITTVFSICMLISILFLWIGMLAFPSEEAIINNQFMIVGAYLGCKTSEVFWTMEQFRMDKQDRDILGICQGNELGRNAALWSMWI